MTPIDQQLREKWEKEAAESLINRDSHFVPRTFMRGFADGYLAACEARHREYQERVATTAKGFAQWVTEERWKEEHLAERSLDYWELWNVYIQRYPPQP